MNPPPAVYHRYRNCCAARKLVIASRESRLALWQAEHVRAALQQYYPACDVSILGMTTRGDQILDRTLSKVGGKGLFVKGAGGGDGRGPCRHGGAFAQDVPMELPAGFTLAAVMTREDPRDALVSERFASLAEMPPGTVVGTSSLRREAACAHATRIWRSGRCAAISTRARPSWTAATTAPSSRRGRPQAARPGARIRALLAPEDSLPAAGQGRWASRSAPTGRLAARLAPLNDNPTFGGDGRRAVSRALGGSCRVPLAAHARWDGTQLRLDAFVALPDGTRCLRASAAGPAASAAEAERLGAGVGDELLAQGPATSGRAGRSGRPGRFRRCPCPFRFPT